MKKGMICFDMDGTIADLCGVDGWLEYIKIESPYPYIAAKPLYNMEKLNKILNELIDHGWEIRVISWLAKNSSEEFNKTVRETKIRWLLNYNFPCSKIHLVAYGTTKANCIRKIIEKGSAILVDDNKKVRDGWHMGETIDPSSGNLIEQLEFLLEK